MFEIRPVDTRRALSTFIKLPRLLYRGMPGYVPPLDFERRQLFDPRKAKFFEHAEVQYWVAYRGAEPVGRISAQIDRLAIETWGENIGCFGCLDAIDDASVVEKLCHTAAAWLRQRGMTRMRGPFALSINGESGMQISGQASGSMVLMPWHPSYLASHVERAGLKRAKELLAYVTPVSKFAQGSFIERARGRFPPALKMRELDLRNMAREASLMRDIFNQAWQHNWSFVPITEPEIQAFAKGFGPYMVPEFGLFAEIEGKLVAVAVVLPNLFELIHDFGGRLLPFNWLRFAVRQKQQKSIRSVRVALFGVVPHLHRIGAVLVFAMLDELLSRSARYRIETIEMGWILEDNRPVHGLMHAFGVEPTKSYRLFEQDLAR